MTIVTVAQYFSGYLLNVAIANMAQNIAARIDDPQFNLAASPITSVGSLVIAVNLSTDQ